VIIYYYTEKNNEIRKSLKEEKIISFTNSKIFFIKYKNIFIKCGNEIRSADST